jgi:hypothetical protein
MVALTSCKRLHRDYAIAYRHYSNDYVSAEETAKAAKRGLWAGTFEMPSDYRHDSKVRQDARPRASPSRSGNAAASAGCVIKGNRGSHGWIYHLPGMPYYERTRAEQTFCTEADAQAAGYRRARVQ